MLTRVGGFIEELRMARPPEKRPETVRSMFDRIAWRYDLLNRVISFHFDTLWRRQAVKALCRNSQDGLILDLGTGTGDLALAAARTLQEGRIVGLDFSWEMLRLAQEKKLKEPAGQKITYVVASALAPPFREQTFDTVMTAFVLRNIPDLGLFFVQSYRLLKPGGRLLTLDMFPPSGRLFPLLYSFYFYRLVPWIGAALAFDRSAYQYLSDSVKSFDAPESIAGLIEKAGFRDTEVQKFLGGAVCVHLARRR